MGASAPDVAQCRGGLFRLLLAYSVGAFGTLPSGMLSGSATEGLIQALARSSSGPILDMWISPLAPFSLVYRFTKKPWLAVAAAGLFAFITATGQDRMELLPAVPYFFWVVAQMLILSAVFWLTDLLSCMVAVFTAETFLLTFTIVQLFGRTEPCSAGN